MLAAVAEWIKRTQHVSCALTDRGGAKKEGEPG